MLGSGKAIRQLTPTSFYLLPSEGITPRQSVSLRRLKQVIDWKFSN